MVTAHCLGFPRIGRQREMKRVVEAYWRQELDQKALLRMGHQVKMDNWISQKAAGLDWITVGDFSWYDHVLDTAMMLGAIPERFQMEGSTPLDTLFRMARGRAPTGEDVPALEMTKWFDTNYHYIVPELTEAQAFSLNSSKLLQEIHEAKAAGFSVKPVILGPLSFLWLSKIKGYQYNKLKHLDALLKVYHELGKQLILEYITWVQIDEPILGLDLPQAWKDAFEMAYAKLRAAPLKFMLTTYFNGLEDNLNLACHLPTEGLHIDCVRAPHQLAIVLDRLPTYKVLSIGVIDGRNVWRANLSALYDYLQNAKERLGDRLWIGSSCSLLHSPVDLELETDLDSEIKSWLAFSTQKVKEISVLAKSLTTSKEDYIAFFAESDKVQHHRATSSRIHHHAVKERTNQIDISQFSRQSSFKKRNEIQAKQLQLPLFPTTTIGSFPQTQTIRRLRQEFKDGKLSKNDYEVAIQAEIRAVVEAQNVIGLDVLVHGEAERNDMVEYFGEQLNGFAFTKMGWVQSYGSRCVKPPIIYGDVSRAVPMTVKWSQYAQSLTNKPMKGMLTGPVTILSWSFVRNDQSRSETAFQIALALRDELNDLEKIGIKIIQVDEPAFREGMPLRKSAWAGYLEWAVKAFKLSVSGVADATQIHTHMCYSEFNDIIESIAAMDADVITMETSRSQMELLEAFEAFSYPNQIGPGVYDVHSPRVPTVEEMVILMEKAAQFIPAGRLWVNPDCGLKTREWFETKAALENMVKAANLLRSKFGQANFIKKETRQGVVHEVDG